MKKLILAILMALGFVFSCERMNVSDIKDEKMEEPSKCGCPNDSNIT